MFGGAAPEGLPAPPEPQDDDTDSLDAVPIAAKPDLLEDSQGMSKEMMEELGIFEGEETAAPEAPKQAECDLLGDLSLQQQYPPVNPFVGIGEDSVSIPAAPAPGSVQAAHDLDRDSLEREFDPMKEWGAPDGLPAPIPPTDPAADNKKSPRNGPTKTATKTGVKKVDPAAAKKPAPAAGAKTTATKKPASAASATRKPAAAPAPAPAAPKPEKKENGAKLDTTLTKKPASATVKKTRTSLAGSAAAAANTSKATPVPKASLNTTITASKSSLNTTTTTGAARKTAAPVTPFYVDLTYIPAAADLEFFRRVRARHYVLSALEPCPKQLDALLEAKATWGDDMAAAEVTIIPTYDTEDLRRWMGLQREALSAANVQVAPSASRCTIQLQDHHTSCAAYRLEF